jgi:hypothetical protein
MSLSWFGTQPRRTRTSYELDRITIHNGLDWSKGCRSCGAARDKGWCCAYCQTPYPAQPTLYGGPISFEEMAAYMEGDDLDVVAISMRRTDSGGPR